MTRVTTDQIYELLEQDRSGRVTRDLLQEFLRNPGRFAIAPAQGAKENEAVATPTAQQIYPLSVVYGLPLAQMIAVGNYDWEHSDITAEHFPVPATGQTEIGAVLVHLNKAASTEEVLQHLDSHGLRPATIAELLAFGAKYPEIQREFPVIALGSVWVGPGSGRRVAYLDGGSRERSLDLVWYGHDWNDDCRFLAVSK